MPELWKTGSAHWSFPIAVEWPFQNDVAAVTLWPIPILSIQRADVEAFLAAHGKKHDGHFWILRNVLTKIAHQIEGDPEKAVVWHPVSANFPVRRDGDVAEKRKAFFEDYARYGVITDPVRAEIVFVSFERHILHTLLNLQKPVDMGFCELAPFPYRPGWRSHIFQAEWEAPYRSRNKNKSLADITGVVDEMIKRGVAERMMNPRLLFWCEEDKHIYWSLEVRPKAPWWKMVKAVEKEKGKGLPHGGYFRLLEDTLKRFIPQALQYYGSFVQQIRKPWVSMGHGRYRCARGQKARGSGEKMGVVCENDPPRPHTLAYRNGKESRAFLDDLPKVSRVPPVPNFQPETNDVRNAGATVEQSTNGQT